MSNRRRLSTASSETSPGHSGVSSSLALATWGEIKQASENGTVTGWNIGDIKPITLNDGNTYNLRLVDETPNRYKYHGRNKYARYTFEFTNVIKFRPWQWGADDIPEQYDCYDHYVLNSNWGTSQSQTTRGWIGFESRTQNMLKTFPYPPNPAYNIYVPCPKNLYDYLIPNDLKSVLEDVEVYYTYCNYGSLAKPSAPAQDKIFLPTVLELGGPYNAVDVYLYETNYCGPWNYYSSDDYETKRIKHDANNQAHTYWLRNVSSISQGYVGLISGNDYSVANYPGKFTNIANTYNKAGFAPCFAI